MRCSRQYCNLNFSSVYLFLNSNILNLSFSLGILLCCMAIENYYHRKNCLVTFFFSFRHLATYFDQFDDWLRRNERDITVIVHRSSCKYPLFLSDVN